MTTTTELARMCFFLLELSVDHLGSHVTFVVVVDEGLQQLTENESSICTEHYEEVCMG